MPQRREDYMSTKNPGGNRRGGTDATPNDPFAYVKVKPEHAYLGHFRSSRFLEEGHNVSPLNAISRRSARRTLRAAGQAGATPYVAERAAAVSAARPVVAARVAARQAAAAGPVGGGARMARREAGRAAVMRARLNPESRLSERAAAGSKGAQRRLKRIAKRLG